ncbi:MAG: hypothetical protein PHQ90_06955 [Sulfuricurvum sp.]|uniref:hypothetical protein n=1 Tax=Sulfuricurvum sp. TaxID=2025608 RepID=UPI00262BF7D9|nr:hypothetical protein [Sulfuricurvum sp.]MDD2369026.1 hypothetical protein [Sulfuricurvum sp.]MDD5117876.1 hypothetical protein [Sulfuricurvum sp.]
MMRLVFAAALLGIISGLAGSETIRSDDLLEGKFSTSTPVFKVHKGTSLIAGKGDNALFALNTSGEITFRELPNVKKAHNDYTIVLNEANSEITLSIRVMNDVIDLGKEGKLIAPVHIGKQWFYYWDRSGDGTSENSGVLNSGADFVSFDHLNVLFNHDAKGKIRREGINNLYRYGMINGIQLALPTSGTGKKDESSPAHAYTVDRSGKYSDLCAIWAASGFTAPAGWIENRYGAATPSGLGYSALNFENGEMSEMIHYNTPYVALEVL